MEKKVFYSPVCLLARTERTLLRVCAALFAMVTAGPALAANSTIEGYYTGEVLYNADGGLTTGSAYLDDAGVVITSEFDSIFGNFDAIFFGYVLYNNSSSFSADYVGDIQGVSNIDAIEALRIYELWYEQGLSESTSLRIGLYDLNTEFDAFDIILFAIRGNSFYIYIFSIFLNGFHDDNVAISPNAFYIQFLAVFYFCV